MRIIKESGEIENFDEGKLINSLLKARATNELVEEIVAHIKTELKEGMGTDQIYKHASFLLKKKSRKVEISYSLKRAVLDLGPSGFPFEKFIGEILREKGFKVINNLLIKGRCAEHELDVLAYNENKLITAEAKFHNSLGVKSDLKTALYVKAKFDDFKDIKYNYGKERNFDENWLITNTKFTSSALNYGRCNGMILISWNNPKKGNLQDLIEDSGLHPLTCLESLSSRQKSEILKSGIVLCKKLIDNSSMLKSIGLSEDKIKRVNEETALVCNIQ